MRHLNSGRKLNRTSSHRKAMLANLATSILEEERVTTTVAKAKEVRGVVERLITYGKKGNLAAIRQAARTVRDKDVLKKLFDDIAPTYEKREGGYTRVMKLRNRKGDNAELAIIELVGREGDEPRKRGGGKKKAARKSTPKPAAASGAEEKPPAAQAPAEEPKEEATAPQPEEAAQQPAAETSASEESEKKTPSEDTDSEAAEEK